MLCVAAKYPFGRVFGLELSHELSSIAKNNIARSQSKFSCQDISIITADARQSPHPDDLNLVYLNNPFVGDIFTTFIDRVCTSLARRPRLLLLIYHNPVMHEHLVARLPCAPAGAKNTDVCRAGQSIKLLIASDS
jgi:hypothetical protein